MPKLIIPKEYALGSGLSPKGIRILNPNYYPVSAPTKSAICSLFSCANFLIIFLLLNFSKSSLVFRALALASCAFECNLSALSNPFFAAALPECAKSITRPTGVLA
jgi:hypothetical protein